MSLLDLLQAATAGLNHAQAEQHFDRVAASATPDQLGQGVAEALRSDQTPPLDQMVGQLFGQSDPLQRAGMLNSLVRSLGPAVLAGLAGNVLGKLSNNGATPITPDQASRLSPEQVQDITRQAAQAQPGIADHLGRFYAEHPALVKGLGGAALLIALSKMRDALGRR